MIKNPLSVTRSRRRRALLIAGAVSALGAFSAAPALASPSGPTLFEGSLGLTSSPPEQSTAVDADGDAVMVWGATDGNGHYFEDAAARPAGGEWGAPVPLSPEAFAPEPTPGQIQPPTLESSVAFGPAGEAVAVWTRPTATGRVVEAATLASIAGSWGQAVELPAVGNEPVTPAVAIGPDGSAIAVWASGSSQGVEAAELPRGGSWASIGQLSRSSTVEHAFAPLVKFDPQGDALVVWSAADVVAGGVRVVVDSRVAGEEDFEGPVLPFAKATSIEDKDLAFDEAGNATLLWASEENNVSKPVVAEAPAGGSWTSPVALTNEFVYGPRLAVAPDGEAIVVWQAASGQANIEATTRAFPGAAWPTFPTQLTSFTGFGESATEPRITIGEEGNALVSWTASSLSGESQEISMRRPSGVWVEIGQVAEEGSRGPALAGDPAGESILSWTHEGELETLVFDASAPRIAALSVPAEGTVGVPVEFEATIGDMTHVGVEWEAGDGQTGAGPVAGFTYAQPGTYSVKMTAEDQLGNVTTKKATITIKPASSGGGEETKSGGDGGGSTSGSGASTAPKPAATPVPAPGGVKLVSVSRRKATGVGTALFQAPAAGTITVFGPGVKKTTVKVTGTGPGAKLALVPKGAFKRQLARRRHAWTKVTIVFTPADGTPAITTTRRVRLVQR
jgi:PKD repeat protein